MEIKGKNVLVTGGAGFIGSHLVDKLLSMGAYVRVIDNLTTGSLLNVDTKRVEFIRGDVRSEGDVSEALKGIDIVFHEAAQINPAKAVEEPMFDFDVNARGTLNVLLHSLKAGVKKILMASTNVYGDAKTEYMKEEFSTLSISRSLLSPYAASKVSAEAYLKVANDELGLPTVRLRYFNVYGYRQLVKSESGVIAIFTLNALAGKPLKIFGDGSHTRDFVYVDDVVQANILAAQNETANGSVLNVGTGVETSVNEVAETIRNIVGKDVPIQHVEDRAADFKRAKACLDQSRSILGYSSTVSLQEGLENYIDWCRKNLSCYK